MSSEQYFTVKRHEPWLYSIKDKMEVFCWLAVGEHSALLFDTGYGIGDLPGEVRKITDKPLTVMLSHGHADHAMGAYQFDRVLLHANDVELIKEHCGPVWRQKAIDGVEKNRSKLGACVDGFNPEAYLAKGTGSITVLEEDAKFDLGGLTIHVIPMPGHTKGSVGLLFPQHGILLTGDAANRATFMFLPESMQIAEYLKMLETVSNLDFTTHYVGHQDTAYPKKWFAKYIKVAENALNGKGKPMKIPGFEEYGEILVSSVGGPILSPSFCAVAFTAAKL